MPKTRKRAQPNLTQTVTLKRGPGIIFSTDLLYMTLKYGPRN